MSGEGGGGDRNVVVGGKFSDGSVVVGRAVMRRGLEGERGGGVYEEVRSG